MTQVPVTLGLGRAVALVEALEQSPAFGQGTIESPLFPVDVQILGTDGNSFAVTGVVERSVRNYLRSTSIDRRYAHDIARAVREELWSARSHDEFVERVRSLVRAH